MTWRYVKWGTCPVCEDADARIYEVTIPGVRNIIPPRMCLRCAAKLYPEITQP